MWDGYRAALTKDPKGVAAVLSQVHIKQTDERQNLAPSIQTELAWVIEKESAWNPAATNPTSKATGLIQFMPSTAVMLGTTVDKLRKMSRAQQAPYVQAFFDKVNQTAARVGDVYLMVFMPGYTTADDDVIISDDPDIVWQQNPGLRGPGNGPITVGGVRRAGTPPTSMTPGPYPGGKIPGGKTPGKTPGGQTKPPAQKKPGPIVVQKISFGLGVGELALLAAGLYLLNKERKKRKRGKRKASYASAAR